MGRSDKNAIKQCIRWLTNEHHYIDAVEACHPTDIEAINSKGEKEYIELKMTESAGDYFGAATLTELQPALEQQGKLKFVIAKKEKNKEVYSFYFMSHLDFIDISTIPPFKTYFHIKPNEYKDSTNDIILVQRKHKEETIRLSLELIKLLSDIQLILRNDDKRKALQTQVTKILAKSSQK